MTCETKPLLYAELLPNINQVTLYAYSPIPTPDSADVSSSSGERNCSVSLSQCRRTVTVSSERSAEYLDLPTRVAEGSHTLLDTLAQHGKFTLKSKEPLFRFRADTEHNKTVHQSYETDVGISTPWTAKHMCPRTRLRCRKCHTGFLNFPDRNDVHVQWKDLPSADWAEMMDLWHCHKPDDHEHAHKHSKGSSGSQINSENDVVKGYGAANKLVCSRGVVLVDAPSFLVTEGDVTGLEIKVRYIKFVLCYYRIKCFVLCRRVRFVNLQKKRKEKT